MSDVDRVGTRVFSFHPIIRTGSQATERPVAPRSFASRSIAERNRGPSDHNAEDAGPMDAR
jgi:hypothetical protein